MVNFSRKIRHGLSLGFDIIYELFLTLLFFKFMQEIGSCDWELFHRFEFQVDIF